MSNKTSFLGLSLLDTSSENSTHFKDWSRNINLEGDEDHKSDFQKIDEFAQHIYGVSGVATLTASSWNAETLQYKLTVDALGNADAIFFSPADTASKEKMENANCFVQCEGKTVTFTAIEVPTENIALNYFISRGK